MMHSNIEENEKALMLLKRAGPLPLITLAKEMGLTTEGARFNLLRLSGEGLVTASTVVKGRGRPQQVWSLTAAGHSRFPDAHAEITVKLIEKVRTLFGEDGIQAVIASTAADGKERYKQAIKGGQNLEEKVKLLAAMRNAEGYMAHYKKEGTGYLLIEDHCPICSAATACQGFCSAELNVFKKVLGAKVTRVEHLLGEGRRCTYRIE